MAATPAGPPTVRSRSVRTVLPSIAGLVGCILLAVVNEARGFDLWRNYALTGLAEGGIITWILWRVDARIPHYIQWAITTAAMLHYGGGSLGSPDPYRMGLFGFHGINGAYHTYDWWDHLTHGFGIGAATMAASYLVETYQARRALRWSSGAVWLMAVLIGLALGVAVELAEYLGKSVFNTIDQGGYANTMLDLHYNMLGASVGGALAAWVARRRRARGTDATAPATPTAPWPRRLPAALVGVAGLVTPMAAMTVALAIRFTILGEPAQDGEAYDAALNTLLASALTGLALALPAAFAWRRLMPIPETA